MTAPVTGAAHQARLAATLRTALGTPKPAPGRRVAAQTLHEIRANRRLTAVDVFETAANVAGRLACVYLREGATTAAFDYAHAEQLLRDRADRARLARIVRVGWAA